MSAAEVMTVALVAATFFGGNQDLSRLFLKEHGYINPFPLVGGLALGLRREDDLRTGSTRLICQISLRVSTDEQYLTHQADIEQSTQAAGYDTQTNNPIGIYLANGHTSQNWQFQPTIPRL